MLAMLASICALPALLVIHKTLFKYQPENAMLTMRHAIAQRDDQLFVSVADMQRFFRDKKTPWANPTRH